MDREICPLAWCTAREPHRHPLLAEGTFAPRPSREEQERDGTMTKLDIEVLTVHCHCPRPACGAEFFGQAIRLPGHPLPEEPVLRVCDRCVSADERAARAERQAARERRQLQAPRRPR